jgi:hypothetical protein
MTRSFLILLAALGLLGLAASASADCVWRWDCTSGPCRQVPLCQNAIDLPPLKPLELGPLAPPSLAPLPTPTLPPLGTTACAPRYLCSSDGRCHWETVCR